MKGCTVKAPILPKVPAGPTKTSSSPSPATKLAICSQYKYRFVKDRGSCSAGKAVMPLGSFPNKRQGAGGGVLCPAALFMAPWYHGVRHGADPRWTHGTGFGSDLEVG